MQNRDLVLGIDTSNYTTSVALTTLDGRIEADVRRLLKVKQGERGLRQSDALYQHMENLPEMLLKLLGEIDKGRIGAIAASERPRPVEGSYMPVFKAGVNYGKVMAASLGVPFFGLSHQEGHLAAVLRGSSLSSEDEFLAYHLSGGTCELLHVKSGSIRILGGTKDLSFGQVIDRIGVLAGMEFPAGAEMDRIALEMRDKDSNIEDKHAESKEPPVKVQQHLKKIPVDGLAINLSGIETQCRREIEQGTASDQLIFELFSKISSCLCLMTDRAVAETGCIRILFTGGVSASMFIREEIQRCLHANGLELVFGDPALSSDNAVGISFLGGEMLWQQNQ
jgi:N6-L-threonylcarbamoyladenine synthase